VFKFCAYLRSYLKLNFPILSHIQETCKALNLQTNDVIMCSIVRALTHFRGQQRNDDHQDKTEDNHSSLILYVVNKD